MTFSPGAAPRTVRAADGQVVAVLAEWELLPPGDGELTRRVKAAGDHWAVAEKKGRQVFSRAIWAPAATIQRIREELEAERAKPAYARSRDADARRRAARQAAYVEESAQAVVAFLGFYPSHAGMADRLASLVADHATPVGSGPVARTKRIPVEPRAEAAVIAWLRQQTNGYDSTRIPRVKGGRREVRRLLATRSRELLAG
jgi:TfoX/Sxy family transcriptional regulator of competence genes